MNWRDEATRIRAETGKSWRNIADEVGVNRRTVERWVQSQNKTAAEIAEPVSPDMTPYQQTVHTKLDPETGEMVVSNIWARSSSRDAQKISTLQAFGDALVQRVQGLAEPVILPEPIVSDRINVIPMGDPHFGMRGWKPEAGDHFDIDIARKLMVGAAHYICSVAPPADTALLINLGDMLHADNGKNETPGSGHPLDVDGRFAKVFMAAVDVMQEIVELLLKKHNKVIVRNVRGNHDPTLSWCLTVAMHAYWRNEPRVTIDLEPGDYWFFEFGKILIGACHGHLAKADALPGIMARDAKIAWGRTDHHHWYVGHFHHQYIRDIQGVNVEVCRTLAPSDAWAHGAGYRSLRSLDCITLHKEWGYETRARCCDKRAMATYEAMEVAA